MLRVSCGIGSCGACTVHHDPRLLRLPVDSEAGCGHVVLHDVAHVVILSCVLLPMCHMRLGVMPICVVWCVIGHMGKLSFIADSLKLACLSLPSCVLCQVIFCQVILPMSCTSSTLSAVLHFLYSFCLLLLGAQCMSSARHLHVMF